MNGSELIFILYKYCNGYRAVEEEKMIFLRVDVI